jgi:nitrous oxidase accessory protein NosD
MRHLGVFLAALALLAGSVQAARAVILQDAYDAAGPGEGFDKLLVLDPELTYTGALAVQRGIRSCIHGNGAVINLENKSIWVPGYGTFLDIDHCVLTDGYSGLYVSEDAGATIRNNTIVANGYGVTSWLASTSVVIENNIIVGNAAYGVYCREYFEPFLQYNTVWGNTGGNYMKNCG